MPITIKARKEGVTPQQIVDRYHQLIKSSFEGLGMSFDIYSRTSSKTHAATASEFFRKLYDEGKFIERTSEQYYDEETQTFLADRYIVGTCPRCGGTVYEGKKGFFCDNRDCAFALWKDNKFFSGKKKSITKSVAAALLKEGRVSMSGLYSEKTGKTYDAVVLLDDTGGKYVNFKLEFPAKKGRKK